MAKIKIQNIGAIANVEMEINKVNVIMGEQSSGKSTIAKLISYCQWIEKRRLLDGEYNEKVEKQLFNFHHLHQNYFNENSYFEYVSDYITISYTGNNLQKTEKIIVNEKKILDYKKTKNIYIPAERNFVSVVPNLKKYNETNDNILNLIYDWFSAKQNFTKEDSLPVLNFGIDYYYQKNADVDMLILNKVQKEISLETGSSGLQSVTPLIVLLEYLTNYIYKEKLPFSVIEENYLLNLLKQNNLFDITKDLEKGDNDKQYKVKNFNELTDTLKKFNIKDNLIQKRAIYHCTQFIIEEPEQNLFPSTQRDLIYYILEKLNSEREHSLLITTHSPYILYALNNCMLGEFVSKKMKASDKEKLKCIKSFINPKNVSIYEIHDGVLKNIQQDDGLLGKNYFDANMKELMDDFYVMLNYYGND